MTTEAGRHEDWCAVWKVYPHDCDCGLHDRLQYDEVRMQIGPWRRSGRSYEEGEPPHPHRGETRASLSVIWADADHSVALAVSDHDGCWASVLDAPPTRDSALREIARTWVDYWTSREAALNDPILDRAAIGLMVRQFRAALDARGESE